MGRRGRAQWPQDRPVWERGGRSSQRPLPRGDGGYDGAGDGSGGEEALGGASSRSEGPGGHTCLTTRSPACPGTLGLHPRPPAPAEQGARKEVQDTRSPLPRSGHSILKPVPTPRPVGLVVWGAPRPRKQRGPVLPADSPPTEATKGLPSPERRAWCASVPAA